MSRPGLPERVLDIARRHRVDEPNAEAGFDRLRALGCACDNAALASAVAACVRDGTLADPVFLADGALQCRWRLVPTPNAAKG
ncbi:MAG: hypothetical protein JOZ42_04635 [Acetobacteraceae bacterium]|nr:hypothetical protein [Acetobacteraceae bacterium]